MFNCILDRWPWDASGDRVIPVGGCVRALVGDPTVGILAAGISDPLVEGIRTVDYRLRPFFSYC